jgi:hypothetical protein
VGDRLNYTGVVDKNGFKEYQIKEGKSAFKSEMGLLTHKSSQTDSNKIKLFEFKYNLLLRTERVKYAKEALSVTKL